jgi:hypothetical protein
MSDTADRPTRAQIHVVLAAYLGWTLDAFDFFVMAFVLREVAATFGAPIGSVAFAITLTLACRAVGRCRAVRPAGRPLRAASDADGQYIVLFAAGVLPCS